jgi:stage IV sporulation protein FB
MMSGLPTLRFRIGPIPVQVELFFFLTVLLLGVPEQDYGAKYLLLWGLVACISVLLQEILHAFLLRWRLHREPEVVLHALGGATYAPGGLTPRQKIWFHLLPALLILAFVGIPARIWYESFDLRTLTSVFTWRLAYDIYFVNFWWSVLNLIPIWPLDGGQAFAGVTEWRSGRTNWPVVHWVSIVIALGGGIYALTQSRGNEYLYVFVFGAVLAVQNFLRLRGSRGFLHPVYEADAGSLAMGAAVPRPRRERDDLPARPSKPRGKPTERLARGYAALQRGELSLARTEAESVRSGKASALQSAMAAEIIAWSWLQERNVPRARSALSDVAERSSLSRSLLAALELTGGDEQRALRNVADALVHEPDGPPKRQVVDYVGRRGLGVDLARQLLDLPNGQGFEAAVRLVAVLADCGRRDQADQVSELLFGL